MVSACDNNFQVLYLEQEQNKYAFMSTWRVPDRLPHHQQVSGQK
jgi:hypothetical protein